MDMSALAETLDSRVVKTRKQGGSQVSYIEAWHAISEANRIFGFDGWTRETVSLVCLSERERTIGQAAKAGWGVTYSARVRVTARGPDGEWVAREGSGAGHGIDVDCGQAHESALKEAESDAMKRALMTFGNAFGLALYDKAQTNVEDGAARENFERFVADKLRMIPEFKEVALLENFWKHLDKPIRDDARIIAALKTRKAAILSPPMTEAEDAEFIKQAAE
jgi:DNA recombination protein Rad52